MDNVSHPMHFDRYKCCYRLSKPSEEDLPHYKIVELTCLRSYEPQQRQHSSRIKSSIGSPTQEWRARMAYPALEVMEKTLHNTTNIIKTL